MYALLAREGKRMKTVHEVSKISGVSVRTLHYYDSIGLLLPAETTNAGYRLYDDSSLERLQSILLFRELEFPLKEIKAILDNPDFDYISALSQQITLLEMKKEHLERLIVLARDTIRTGVNKMEFSAFDNTEIKRYAEEARQKWGSTAAYREYENRNSAKTDSEKNDVFSKMDVIFSEAGKLRSLSPDCEQAQNCVKKLQDFITENCYTCTKEILSGLGQMYVGDERFRQNIDNAGGEGTAAFVAAAIEFYCR